TECKPVNRQVSRIKTQQVFHRMKKHFVFGKKYFQKWKQRCYVLDLLINTQTYMIPFLNTNSKGFKIHCLYSPARLAITYSRFNRAMCDSEISFGHSASHAPVLVQLPNPASSCASIIFSTRR